MNGHADDRIEDERSDPLSDEIAAALHDRLMPEPSAESDRSVLDAARSRFDARGRCGHPRRTGFRFAVAAAAAVIAAIFLLWPDAPQTTSQDPVLTSKSNGAGADRAEIMEWEQVDERLSGARRRLSRLRTSPGLGLRQQTVRMNSRLVKLRGDAQRLRQKVEPVTRRLPGSRPPARPFPSGLGEAFAVS